MGHTHLYKIRTKGDVASRLIFGKDLLRVSPKVEEVGRVICVAVQHNRSHTFQEGMRDGNIAMYTEMNMTSNLGRMSM